MYVLPCLEDGQHPCTLEIIRIHFLELGYYYVANNMRRLILTLIKYCRHLHRTSWSRSQIEYMQSNNADMEYMAQMAT